MERKVSPLNLFPTLGKLRLGLRPKDVMTLMSEPLRLNCISSLGQLMPTLYAVMDITIEVFDGMPFKIVNIIFILFAIADRFEQFTA